jgi:hypothetical protein
MKKYWSLLTINILLLSVAFAQQDYNVDLINPVLRKSAVAITRTEETKLVIKNVGSATLYNKYAITIFSEAGDKYARFFEEYDKFKTVDYVEGNLYDAHGKKIKAMKKSELNDIALNDGFSLMWDGRAKTYNFAVNVYPYTIEYISSVNLNGLMFLPSWKPVKGYDYAIENSVFTVECPTTYKLRYKTFDYHLDPVITTLNNNTSYEWSIKSLPGIDEEKYSPQLHELTPSVLLAPTDFKLNDYSGDMNSWSDLGKFFYTLNEGRDVLPDNIKKEVHRLTDNISDTVNKIKTLYSYLQKNTRYVGVQLGIGGWQTFDAGYVAKYDYGDCKALSNYMHSMLKEAGIKSNCTLINAGYDNTYFDSDFPSAHFNHVIVCVPMVKDTMWLECTNQTLPAGYLSGFTANRNALLVDENNSKLVHTPVYKMTDNLHKRYIKATVDSDGKLTAIINTQLKGLSGDHLHNLIHELSKDKIIEFLKNNIDLPSYDIVNFSYTEDSLLVPSIFEQLQLTANNYAQVTGKRLFIMPNVLARNNLKLQEEDRKSIIKLPYQYEETDTADIQIPDGYAAESIPATVNIDTKFGTYYMSVKLTGNKILYYRKREQESGDFPATDYPALVNYFDKIYRSDHTKIVLAKIDGQ